MYPESGDGSTPLAGSGGDGSLVRVAPLPPLPPLPPSAGLSGGPNSAPHSYVQRQVDKFKVRGRGKGGSNNSKCKVMGRKCFDQDGVEEQCSKEWGY